MVKYANVIKEITFPLDEGVKFNLDGKKLEVTGPKGKIMRDFTHAKSLSIQASGKDKIVLEVTFPRKKDRAIVGTIEGHIKNMITGTTKGFKYLMKIVYAHFPITVKIDKKANNVEIQNFIGERGHRIVPIMGDVKISSTKEDVIIEGIDKDIVGQNAANIQLKTKVVDKDLRIFQDGIYVFEKWAGDTRFWHIKT